MPYLITLALLSLSLIVSAQEEMQLSLSNGHPRAGEEITIFISNNFTEVPASIHGHQENMQLSTIVFEEAREYTVGPFEFNFDGKTYTTNSIQVKVEQALPVQEGIWLRWYEEKGRIIVLVEQMIPLEQKITTSLGTTSSSYESVREPAKIIEYPQAGIHFDYRSSASRGIAKNNSFRGPHYTYYLQKYVVRMDADMKKGFKLLPKHFEQFKKGLPYTPITIPYLKKS